MRVSWFHLNKETTMKDFLIDAITFAAFITTMYGGTIIIWGMAG